MAVEYPPFGPHFCVLSASPVLPEHPDVLDHRHGHEHAGHVEYLVHEQRIPPALIQGRYDWVQDPFQPLVIPRQEIGIPEGPGDQGLDEPRQEVTQFEEVHLGLDVRPVQGAVALESHFEAGLVLHLRRGSHALEIRLDYRHEAPGVLRGLKHHEYQPVGLDNDHLHHYSEYNRVGLRLSSVLRLQQRFGHCEQYYCYQPRPDVSLARFFLQRKCCLNQGNSKHKK